MAGAEAGGNDWSGLTPAEITQWFDSPGAVPENTYEIALVLGGTVSAGAYTAGALDFLVEALDSWNAAKASGTVPRHDAIIRVITGTSGGGVNAAMAARALAYDFQPVSRGTAAATAALNPFYNIWVNCLNLSDMLDTADLDAPGGVASSLLNGRAIDAAAATAVGFTGTARAAPRPWLAQPLRLVLTLTNLNGIPYQIDFGSLPTASGGSVNMQESYVDHTDYCRFAVVYPGQDPGVLRPDEYALGFDNVRLANAIDWGPFSQFALGTSAFPIGFPPRRLTRPLQHYRYRVVALPGGADPSKAEVVSLVPDWAAIQDWSGGGLPDDIQFLAVDGGAIDNEPIELARTALAGISGRNPRGGLEANRGVVLIDPFAGNAKMAAPLSIALPDLAQSFLNAIVQQTRYDTRDLLLAAHPDIFSRFMISGLRDNNVGDPALATAGVGAFIGFACAAFRRHDYLLGRKNCQDFLRNTFVLPAASPIFAGRMDGVPAADFAVNDGTNAYLPIIPLVGSARIPEMLDPWPKNALDPSIYRDGIEKRFAGLIEKELSSGPLSSVLAWIVAQVGEGKVADLAINAMNDALKTWNLA
jgi:hypothetical protein